jgi:hypothetical protein
MGCIECLLSLSLTHTLSCLRVGEGERECGRQGRRERGKERGRGKERVRERGREGRRERGG